jgi:hypothetical protein
MNDVGPWSELLRRQRFSAYVEVKRRSTRQSRSDKMEQTAFSVPEMKMRIMRGERWGGREDTMEQFEKCGNNRTRLLLRLKQNQQSEE